MPIVQDEITSHQYSPILVTIWLGANDAALPEGKFFCESPPAARILLITLPMVDDKTSVAVQRSTKETRRV
ncbi:hypothetical protein PHMEG_0004868 [Phytophthora megakarya]|uniref:SGNH hydrolase-type esterase domain-containing protein n=1 Tax=Phytophthora megakarya TaxID=4795 RepID=A0A225WSU6_9STRA|nr:hypothetical protein PHMEG_0004868 [Phytophthora megakarya]